MSESYPGPWAKTHADKADHVMPKGRPLTADEMWEQRFWRARAKLSFEEDRPIRDLMLELGRELYRASEAQGCHPMDDDWVPPGGYLDVWRRIGKVLKIGPPPWA
jgi:hypothetical protein